MVAQLQAEYNNLRAALSWLIRERADSAGALRLAAALPWMWYFGGIFSEGRGWLREALERLAHTRIWWPEPSLVWRSAVVHVCS